MVADIVIFFRASLFFYLLITFYFNVNKILIEVKK